MQNYYLEYLVRTEKFPQSLYHRAKHLMVNKMFADLPFGSSVLDAACGIGNISEPYCKNYRVYGLDEQASAIKYCKKHYSGIYKKADLYHIPYSDNYFDMILFLDAIEHFTKPVYALKELSRVLKPKGKILICTINYANPLWLILENTWHRFFGGHCKAYSKDVHPTRYTEDLLRNHCKRLFKEVKLVKLVLMMELFYIGQK